MERGSWPGTWASRIQRAHRTIRRWPYAPVRTSQFSTGAPFKAFITHCTPTPFDSFTVIATSLARWILSLATQLLFFKTAQSVPGNHCQDKKARSPHRERRIRMKAPDSLFRVALSHPTMTTLRLRYTWAGR